MGDGHGTNSQDAGKVVASARLQKPLHNLTNENIVYDNGAAQMYRLRPRTPYQR